MEKYKMQDPLFDERDIDVLVWDLETSGFVAPKAKILEIGAYIVKDGIVEQKRWVLNNNCDISEEITAINGMTREICEKEGMDPVKVMEEFMPLFKRCKKNVTHNGINFDIVFLTDFVSDLMAYTPENKIAVRNLIRSTAFDTAVHFKAKKLEIEMSPDETFLAFADRIMRIRAAGVKYNLGLCVDEMGVDRAGAIQHRALGDVYLTHELYKMIENVNKN